MDLIHNMVFMILSGENQGTYRVVLDEISINKTAVIKLDPPQTESRSKGGRRKLEKPKNPRKKPPLPMFGQILWIDRNFLTHLKDDEEIMEIQIEQENYKLSSSDEEAFEFRKTAMANFMDFDNLRHRILMDGNISGLVKTAVDAGHSESFIRKNFSLLCHHGFSESSLKPTRSLMSGAPGVARPCDPEGRKKAGAKTTKQKILKAFGVVVDPEQPGMSTHWTNMILAADKRIQSPKPRMPERCRIILESSFVKKYKQIDGRLVALDLVLGEYPNIRQIRRVLEREIPKLQRLLENTTKGHFASNYRGLNSRNWEGVVGPGHTWAIDSTIGDLYLRSSVNRAWIIGRPIVYIMIDVWSTAIVGFYVCLDGPSWDMAKVALFCAVASPILLGELWGMEMTSSLSPLPTMCAVLLCDRGEYLSIAARITGAKLIPCLSYTPPYSPDWKGGVEVMHRIKKDQQYFFVPGAIDQRRHEFELRRFDPTESVLTIPEYAAILQQTFTTYNLTSPRKHRVDAHMSAEGVFPSPAGLWNYGHKVGIGVRRKLSETEIITNLLPAQKAVVTGPGVRMMGMDYSSDEIKQMGWSALSRNFNSWEIDAHYFPGSVSRIWTPNPTSPGLLELGISENTIASPELTFDEAIDALTFGMINNAKNENVRINLALEARRKSMAIIEKARILTADAINKHSGSNPSISEARSLESATLSITSQEGGPTEPEDNSARLAHQEMMMALFVAANNGAMSHE